MEMISLGETVPIPSFLPGELMVARAKNVLRFSAMTESKSGISGALYVTNFRVSFLTTSSSSETPLSSVFQSNPDLSQGGINADIQQELHIPLTCIQNLFYCTSKGNAKYKKLGPSKKDISKIQRIQIHCKDFRVMDFGLKFTPQIEQAQITNAILHYAYPSSMSLLFAFNYSSSLSKVKQDEEEQVKGVTPSFRTLPDWLNELTRLNVDDTWRIANVNDNFKTCQSQSQLFVCLASLTDSDINRMSLHYIESRFPVWCWSHPATGVPILHSASGRPDSIFLEKEETSLFRALSTLPCNPEHKEVMVLDLAKTCPSIRDLAQSFLKIHELCVMETTKAFWSIDPSWLSSLDATRWLEYSRKSLESAVKVATTVCEDGRPVIVKETNGRDMILVVASLAQLILDSYYRTIRGFQTLIQKMWVLCGHPFVQRCGHIKPLARESEKDTDQEAPVFLHFLDCVYQLMIQFPSGFEFSETYLLGLFDSMHACMFDTFLFDCEEQRCSLSRSEIGNDVQMASLWDFLAEQLSNSKTSATFLNPLYELKSSVDVQEEANQEMYSNVMTTAPAMKFWSGCYLRWLPTVHVSIGMGENSASHYQQMILMNEVKVLQHRMAVLTSEQKENEGEETLKPTDRTTWGPDASYNMTLDLESSKFLTPSLPFIGDLSFNKYSTGDFSQTEQEYNSKF